MKLSEEMFEIIRTTHKFTKEPWISKFGIMYIGYCHKITDTSLKTTRMKAKRLLETDLKKIENYVNKLLRNQEIPQNHFDVMCSLAYDIGVVALKNSLFFRLYSKGLLDKASSRIIDWSYIKQDLSLAMQYRRQIDELIFIQNDYNIKRKTK